MKIDILNHTVEIVPTSGHINSKFYFHNYGKTLEQIKLDNEEERNKSSKVSSPFSNIGPPLTRPTIVIKRNYDFDHYVLCFSSDAPFTNICFQIRDCNINFRHTGILFDQVVWESDGPINSQQEEIIEMFETITSSFIPQMQENTKYKLADIL